MDMQSTEYKCFRMCSIHLTCQSWGGGTLADSKLKSVFQQNTSADSKLKSVFQQKFPFGGGYICQLKYIYVASGGPPGNLGGPCLSFAAFLGNFVLMCFRHAASKAHHLFLDVMSSMVP